MGVSTSRKPCSLITLSHELGEPVADDEDPLHFRPAEVEEAILQPQLLVGLGPVHLERRGGRGIVDTSSTARTSIAPVLSLGFSLPGSRGRRSP